jgi:hypothetical protein
VVTPLDRRPRGGLGRADLGAFEGNSLVNVYISSQPRLNSVTLRRFAAAIATSVEPRRLTVARDHLSVRRNPG